VVRRTGAFRRLGWRGGRQSELTIVTPAAEIEFPTMASRANEYGKRWDIARDPGANRSRLNADTSSQPEGITRRVILNVLEAFFRRPVLHLLPLILMLGVGVASVVNMKQQYRSVGTLSVTNESLLADLTDATQSGGIGIDNPATVTARQINELLRTDDFLDEVVEDAGLTSLVESGSITRDKVRAWTGALADGESIVRVGATSESPELSFRLADATIKSYKDWVIASDVSQSTTTETSLETRVAEKQAALDAANTAVADKILEQPGTEIEDRSPIDRQEIERLQGLAVRANDQLVAAEDALDAAKLSTDQAAAIVEQRLQVLDEPAPALAPEGRLKNAAITMIVFGVLGIILSIATVVVSATLDRTIRVPNDITSKFGVDVLAVVPDVAR
jgi:capsular polysaccharide biosynthesis protein